MSKVARLDPAEWMSFDAALTQINSSAGLAVHDLRRDLHSGDLVGASRYIGYKPEQESCEVHERSFWRDVEVREFENRVRIRPLSSDPQHPLFNGQWRFYVRRAELDRRYPHALAPAAGAIRSSRAGIKAPPPRQGGRPMTHDWFSICGEIARRCVNPANGRVRVPTKQKVLVDDVMLWLDENDLARPAESEMQEAVRRVCAAMRKVER